MIRKFKHNKNPVEIILGFESRLELKRKLKSRKRTNKGLKSDKKLNPRLQTKSRIQHQEGIDEQKNASQLYLEKTWKLLETQQHNKEN